MKSAPLFSLSAALALASAAQAQDLARYRPCPDTVYVQSTSDYRLFVVRGADTVGTPVRSLSVERQLWEDAGPALRVKVSRSVLDAHRSVSASTVTLTPAGRVEAVDGAMRSGHDFLPRFPRPGFALAVGSAWADTLSRAEGDYAYTVERGYRVTRVAGEGAARVVEVEATGTARYHDAFPADSAGTRRWWVEVSGPVRESFAWAPATGRVTRRAWSMELRGVAGIPGAGGREDTLAAGVRSSDAALEIAADDARLLTRDLPGADSSVTRGAGVMVLHTVARRGTAVESGMARGDGVVGTARSQWEALPATGEVVPQSYTAVWTDGAGRRELRVQREGRTLRVAGAREARVDLPRPEVAWAVADYGMEEHLVPVLVRLPLGASGVQLQVYRPHEGRWDRYVVLVGALPAARLVTLAPVDPAEAATQPTQLVVTDEGDLLAARNAGVGGDRVPLPGTRRAEKMEDLVAMVKGSRQVASNR
jgi:hypothetical protein